MGGKHHFVFSGIFQHIIEMLKLCASSFFQYLFFSLLLNRLQNEDTETINDIGIIFTLFKSVFRTSQS